MMKRLGALTFACQTFGPPILLEVRADNLDQIFGGFFGILILSRHVVADMVLHKLAHKAVYGSARRSKALQQVRAWGIFVETTQDRLDRKSVV